MYPSEYKKTNVPSAPAAGGIVAMGVAGALVTGSVAAATELRKKENAQCRGQTVMRVGKEALGGGIAWATGAAVAKTLFRSNILGIVAMVAVSAGVKYAYDGLTAPKEAEAEKKTPPAKAAKAK